MSHEDPSHVTYMKTKLVIFDMDGTLYNGSMLRRKMLVELLKYYSIRPFKLKELFILQNFRKEREKLAESEATGINELQYDACATNMKVESELVKKIVKHWILDFPLAYLTETRYEGPIELFRILKDKNIKVAVYSDYPANDKLKKLGLSADLVLSSVDPEINIFKPHHKGVSYILEHFGLRPEDCLIIGDRDDRDGLVARKIKAPYRLVLPQAENTYSQLIQQFQTI